MDWLIWLAFAAALFSAGIGILSLVRPNATADTVDLRLKEGATHGITELRVTYGGYIAGPSLAAMALNDPVGYAVLGGGWTLAALTRAASMVFEKANDGWNRIALISEIPVAVILFLPLVLL
jgi:hypothetical protein